MARTRNFALLFGACIAFAVVAASSLGFFVHDPGLSLPSPFWETRPLTDILRLALLIALVVVAAMIAGAWLRRVGAGSWSTWRTTGDRRDRLSDSGMIAPA
jgi:hypothetical protein